MQNALSELGKEIGRAFVIFINEKLIFKSEFHYFETDGSN